MDFPEHLPHEVFRILPEKPLLLVLDFDGVMTDDRVYVGQDGTETVACTRGDGMGITLLRRAEVPVLVLSTEENPVVGARCRKLRIECRQGCADKTRELGKVLMGEHDGRPHWGKWFPDDIPLERAYGSRLERFERVSHRYDPDHRFLNPILRGLALGAPRRAA